MAAAKYRDVTIADESRTLRVIDIIYAFRAAVYHKRSLSLASSSVLTVRVLSSFLCGRACGERDGCLKNGRCF